MMLRVLPTEVQGCVFQHLSRRDMGALLLGDRGCASTIATLAALRRVHCALRVYPAFRALHSAWLDWAEAGVLARIRDKLVNGAGMSSNFATFADPPASLKAFNESINWLGNYHIDSAFVELLLLENLEVWPPDERRYVKHWLREFTEHWCFGWNAPPSERVTLTPARAWPIQGPGESQGGADAEVVGALQTAELTGSASS